MDPQQGSDNISTHPGKASRMTVQGNAVKKESSVKPLIPAAIKKEESIEVKVEVKVSP
jgi:hypothetical protein